MSGSPWPGHSLLMLLPQGMSGEMDVRVCGSVLVFACVCAQLCACVCTGGHVMSSNGGW